MKVKFLLYFQLNHTTKHPTFASEDSNQNFKGNLVLCPNKLIDS